MGVGLVVSAVAISGAFAYLVATDTATRTNNIKVGTIDIKFADGTNAINIEGNSAIPMSKQNAVETLIPYSFNIENAGNISVDYTVNIDTNNYINTFSADKINIVLARVTKDADEATIKEALLNSSVQKLSAGVKLDAYNNFTGSSKQKYVMIAYIDESANNADVLAKTATFNLIVNSVQHTEESNIDMSNINVADGSTIYAAGDFSTKGNLVTINNTQYRVLSVNNSKAKVMSMNNSLSTVFNNSNVTTNFGAVDGQQYSESKLDKEMMNYYNSLPENIQKAIVETDINQSIYSDTMGIKVDADLSTWSVGGFTESTTSGNNYYLMKEGSVNIGKRKVYAIDIDDIIEYLGQTSNPQDFNELFYNSRSNTYDRWIWTRSAYKGDTARIFDLCSDSGGFGFNNIANNRTMRPVFVIDLSKLS